MLQQVIATIAGSGHLRLRTRISAKSTTVPVLQLDFRPSTIRIDKQAVLQILNVSNERDFKKILSADVDVFIKVAVILCNQLGWKIEFEPFKEHRYSLYIPLRNQPHHALDELLAAAQIDGFTDADDKVSNYYNSPPTQPERIVTSQQSQRPNLTRPVNLIETNEHKPRPQTVDD